jgi:hypothetical protein
MRIYPERAYNFIDRTGVKYGRLTAIELAPKPKGESRVKWVCKCDCGSVVTVCSLRLGCGQTQSCGCLCKERTSQAKKTHGCSGGGSSEYGVWLNMKSRCTHKSVDSYHLYGGRGIKVCDRWLNSFENFLEDMGPRPSKNHSIERKDSNGNYEPGNCKWADRFEQANNKRNNRPITHNGETLNLFQWAHKYKIHPKRLHARLKSGWSMERALTPVIQSAH